MQQNQIKPFYRFFLSHVNKILKFKENPNIVSGLVISKERKRSIKSYKNGAKQRGIEFNIDRNVILDIISNSCYYCGSMEKIGIDRIDSSKGYIESNIVPCCPICNRMKWDLTFVDFYIHLNKINNWMEHDYI